MKLKFEVKAYDVQWILAQQAIIHPEMIKVSVVEVEKNMFGDIYKNAFQIAVLLRT